MDVSPHQSIDIYTFRQSPYPTVKCFCVPCIQLTGPFFASRGPVTIRTIWAAMDVWANL